MDVNQIGNINDGFTKRDNCNQGRVYDTNALSPAINTMQGGGLQPHIAECVVLGGIGDKNSNNGTQFYQQDRVYEMGDVAMCHPANIPGGSYRYLETKCLTEGDDRICLSRAEQSRAEQSRAA